MTWFFSTVNSNNWFDNYNWNNLDWTFKTKQYNKNQLYKDGKTICTIELPGVKKEDIKVELKPNDGFDGSTLYVSWNGNIEYFVLNNTKYDTVEAKLELGVLTVILTPPPEQMPKTIKVEVK